jgi:hypothetical protein
MLGVNKLLHDLFKPLIHFMKEIIFFQNHSQSRRGDRQYNMSKKKADRCWEKKKKKSCEE